MSSGKLSSVVLYLKVAAVPYLLGLLLSTSIIPEHVYTGRALTAPTRDLLKTPDNFPSFDKFLGLKRWGDPFSNLQLRIHRNGEVEACANVSNKNTYQVLKQTASQKYESDPETYNKFEFDALLTEALASGLLGMDECGPYKGEKGQRDKLYGRINNEREDSLAAFISFCDMGPDHTPILPNHDRMIDIHLGGGQMSLPCSWHTREGVRITALDQLAELARHTEDSGEDSCKPQDGSEDLCVVPARELHLYAVPAGRVFMFAPSHVGEIFELPHVISFGEPVSLEVLSLSPRVFDIKNFYSRDESAEIVKKAIAETSDSHRIKRSSTGASGYNVNSRRTSENGFDTHGRVAMEVKRRCFDVLGFDEYYESMADGLQVLRYNKTTAYVPHLDWIDDPGRRQEHNFDSAGTGSNRFGTILLYMSDLGEKDGGETVFAEGWPVGQPEAERKSFKDALRELRDSGDANFLAKGSWEEDMVAKCRSRLAIRPHSSRAVLFYSQHPNGEPDQASLHGGCPVLGGTKWAANLWVWNAPRGGYPGSPKNEHVVKQNLAKGKKEDEHPNKKQATFSNQGTDNRFKNAELYFQDTFWGKLGFGDPPLSVNTYEGHQWNVMVDGKKLMQFIINGEKQQEYSV